MKKTKLVLLSCAGAAAIAAGGAAVAQSGDDEPTVGARQGGLESIVVTATRRETDLQQTPVAVSAFGQDQIETYGIVNARELMGMVPNLYAQRVTTSPSTQTYGMRGLGATDTISDPTVGTYVDGVYLPRNLAQLFDLPGLERIEVLRGPQGTLYGRNSSSGAIKLVTIEPGDDLRFHVSAGVGNYKAYEMRGFVSGPILEGKVFGSIAAMHKERGGYTFNANTDRFVNNLDQSAIRA